MSNRKKICFFILTISIISFGLWTKVKSISTIITNGGDQGGSYCYTSKEFDNVSKIVWQHQIDGDFISEVLVYKDKLVYGTFSYEESIGTIAIADKKTGNVLFNIKANFTKIMKNEKNFLMPGAIKDGIVYFSDNNIIRGYNIDTGKEEWSYEASPANTLGIPMIDNEYIYFSGNDGTLRAVSIKTKKEKWRNEHKGFGLSATLFKGTIYIDSSLGIKAINASSGKEKWTYSHDKWLASGIIVNGNKVFAYGLPKNGNDGFMGALTSLDRWSGKELWCKYDDFNSIQMAVNDEKVYSFGFDFRKGSNGIKIYNAEDGNNIEMSKFNSGVVSNICVVNNKILAAYYDENFRVIDASNYEELGSIPFEYGSVSAPAFEGSKVYITRSDFYGKAYIYCIE